jgi:hypothetical protein
MNVRRSTAALLFLVVFSLGFGGGCEAADDNDLLDDDSSEEHQDE